MGGQSVGKDPLNARFLCGVMRLRPRVQSCVPPWDLVVVLESLCMPPFEPIKEISDRLLTLKTVLLLALSSLKRFGDLQALTVAPSYLDFVPVWPKLSCTLIRGTSLRSPPLYHDLSYSRRFVLLPSGSLIRRSLIECVQCERWTHTSTELPCVEGRTNCWYAMVPLKRVFQLPSRPLVGGQWMPSLLPMSPLISPHHWGSRLTQLKVCQPPRPFSGSTTWICEPILALLFSCPSCAFQTLTRDLQVWQHGHLVPQKRSTQLEFPEGNVPGYVCNHGFPRERDAALHGHMNPVILLQCEKV